MALELDPIRFRRKRRGTADVALELRSATKSDADQWDHTWRPILEGRAEPGDNRWKEEVVHTVQRDSTFPWRTEIEEATKSKLRGVFAIVDTEEGSLEALISVDAERLEWSRLSASKRIVFVDYLGVAPWNQDKLAKERKFTGLGKRLLLLAVEIARGLNYRGYFGLHSTPEAVETYELGYKLWRKPEPEMQADGEWVYFEATDDWVAENLSGTNG